jgi:ABC-type dipeptide/oligopeptide/nickel transport system permease component
MLPCPQSRPEHLAARSAGLGALLGAGLLLWHGHGWGEVGALLQDKLVVDSLGNTVSEALTGRCVTTFCLVSATMALAFTTAALAASLACRLNRRLLAFISLLGQALAALPVAGVAWWMVSGVVNGAHLPVESLIPYVPPPERDQASLAVGRFLWAWLLPLWVLAVPLTGECLHAVSDRLQAAWPLPHALGLKAGGHPPSDGLRQSFRLAWAMLHDHWHAVGLLALGYVVLVEQAFALPGWGAFLADHLHTGSSRGIAAAIYACGWMAAAWALASEVLRRCTLDGPAARWPERASPRAGVSLPGGLLLMGGTVLFAGLVPAYEEQSWVRAFFQPWVYDALSPDLATRLQGLIPTLQQDLYAALTATALALAVALVRGSLAWLTHAQERFPKFLFLESVAWSPLLVWVFALATGPAACEPPWLALGLLAGTMGARQLRDLGVRQRAALHVDAARAAGVPRWSRWRRHILPTLLPWLAGWTVHTLGTLLLWSVLLRSLPTDAAAETGTSLGTTILASKTQVLADPLSAALPTLLTAITVLYFWRLARMVR